MKFTLLGSRETTGKPALLRVDTDPNSAALGTCHVREFFFIGCKKVSKPTNR